MEKLIPRYAFRLEDLRAWHIVEAVCIKCSHRAVINHGRLTQSRPGLMLLSDLEKRLRCLRCGQLRGHTFTIGFRPHD